MNEEPEQTALRFLIDFLGGDETLAKKWRDNADHRYSLMLQLCTSYADKIRFLHTEIDALSGLRLGRQGNVVPGPTFTGPRGNNARDA